MLEHSIWSHWKNCICCQFHRSHHPADQKVELVILLFFYKWIIQKEFWISLWSPAGILLFLGFCNTLKQGDIHEHTSLLKGWKAKVLFTPKKKTDSFGRTLEESIVARSVQIHSLDVPDVPSILYDPPAPPWPPSFSSVLIHINCWGSCARCPSQLVHRWLKS